MRLRKLILLVLVLALAMSTTGCMGMKPYKTPVVEEISPSQTAFLIPLEGDTTDQATFQSEEFLKSNLVSSKRVEIPQRWLKTGRLPSQGKWIPTAKLIVVERQPVVREWTDASGTGTSNKNEGIVAEGKDSIGFMVRMNISAQIEETDATRFLYRYNNKPLDSIMDNELRAMVSTTFVENISHLSYGEIIVNKNTIMENVRNTVVPYFKERGITITVIGLEGEFTPLNAKIQESIDKKFTEEKLSEAQAITNKRNIEQAKAEVEAVNIRASVMAQTIKLKELDNQSKLIEKWNGAVPQVQGSGASIIQLPTAK